VRRRAAALACSVVGCGAVAFALGTSVAPVTGCNTRQCDGNTTNWTTGHWLDANTWETGDVNDPWIPLDGNSTVNIYWYGMDPSAQDPARDVYNVSSFVGAVDNGQKTPNGAIDAGNTFINGSGQPVEYLGWPAPGQPQRVTVFNDSCASYLTRFVVQFVPLGDDAAAAAETARD
jgi:hypothetical protein